MSLDESHVRRTVHYEGRVQGVGFRYTANDIARKFQVTGRVMNLDDGRVKLIAEGPDDEVGRFLNAVSDTLGRYIRNTQMVDSPATSEYDSFAVELAN
jgi:acylphosphatase